MKTVFPTIVLVILCVMVSRSATADARADSRWDWATASPESQGIAATRLETAWTNLLTRGTTAFLVIRSDKVVFERYAPGYSRTKPHGTASMAKALVGGVSLMLAMNDRRIKPDDPASEYVPTWRGDAERSKIMVKHLATHTSGIEDAEADGLPHARLTGWKSIFWQPHEPTQDPFTIARDRAPVLDTLGTKERYSNPGMAMLGYCVTASLRGTPTPDLRSLLKERIMRPLGIADREWSVGYGTSYQVEGLPLVATWGGAAYSANATARVGRLMLHKGSWEGKSLVAPSAVEAVTRHSGLPGHSGLGWWVNVELDGSKLWKSAPKDAYWGAGAGHQFLLVVPSLDLIVVRNGEQLDQSPIFADALERHVVEPVMRAFVARPATYPPRGVIEGIDWAPKETIARKAQDSDNWPITWGSDDALYTAYGDGHGFEPKVQEKLSLGFAKVLGGPTDFQGINIRSATGEERGSGRKGKKASGMLMVDGVLYMWIRNAGNSQLAWSSDRGTTWTQCPWKFTTSFGCPTFLNFGKDYAGARDKYVYVYSPDSEDAYTPADRMVLARVPKNQITEQRAYKFFKGLDKAGVPIWDTEIKERKAVFTNPGRCCRSAITHNPGLRRYLWCQTLPGDDARFHGGFGIYDAPEPWGPWTKVYETESWDVGPGETCSFPTKWMSADGQTLYLVFSGDDSFSVRKATLHLRDR